MNLSHYHRTPVVNTTQAVRLDLCLKRACIHKRVGANERREKQRGGILGLEERGDGQERREVGKAILEEGENRS